MPTQAEKDAKIAALRTQVAAAAAKSAALRAEAAAAAAAEAQLEAALARALSVVPDGSPEDDARVAARLAELEARQQGSVEGLDAEEEQELTEIREGQAEIAAKVKAGLSREEAARLSYLEHKKDLGAVLTEAEQAELSTRSRRAAAKGVAAAYPEEDAFSPTTTRARGPADTSPDRAAFDAMPRKPFNVTTMHDGKVVSQTQVMAVSQAHAEELHAAYLNPTENGEGGFTKDPAFRKKVTFEVGEATTDLHPDLHAKLEAAAASPRSYGNPENVKAAVKKGASDAWVKGRVAEIQKLGVDLKIAEAKARAEWAAHEVLVAKPKAAPAPKAVGTDPSDVPAAALQSPQAAEAHLRAKGYTEEEAADLAPQLTEFKDAPEMARYLLEATPSEAQVKIEEASGGIPASAFTSKQAMKAHLVANEGYTGDEADLIAGDMVQAGKTGGHAEARYIMEATPSDAKMKIEEVEASAAVATAEIAEGKALAAKAEELHAKARAHRANLPALDPDIERQLETAAKHPTSWANAKNVISATAKGQGDAWEKGRAAELRKMGVDPGTARQRASAEWAGHTAQQEAALASKQQNDQAAIVAARAELAAGPKKSAEELAQKTSMEIAIENAKAAGTNWRDEFDQGVPGRKSPLATPDPMWAEGDDEGEIKYPPRVQALVDKGMPHVVAEMQVENEDKVARGEAKTVVHAQAADLDVDEYIELRMAELAADPYSTKEERRGLRAEHEEAVRKAAELDIADRAAETTAFLAKQRAAEDEASDDVDARMAETAAFRRAELEESERRGTIYPDQQDELEDLRAFAEMEGAAKPAGSGLRDEPSMELASALSWDELTGQNTAAVVRKRELEAKERAGLASADEADQLNEMRAFPPGRPTFGPGSADYDAAMAEEFGGAGPGTGPGSADYSGPGSAEYDQVEAASQQRRSFLEAKERAGVIQPDEAQELYDIAMLSPPKPSTRPGTDPGTGEAEPYTGSFTMERAGPTGNGGERGNLEAKLEDGTATADEALRLAKIQAEDKEYANTESGRRKLIGNAERAEAEADAAEAAAAEAVAKAKRLRARAVAARAAVRTGATVY